MFIVASALVFGIWQLRERTFSGKIFILKSENSKIDDHRKVVDATIRRTENVVYASARK